MKVLRWTLKIHKWIALLIGIQIFIWVGTGLYFSWFPIEEIRGEHKRVEWAVDPFEPGELISLEQATTHAGVASVKEAKLGHMLGRPVWRLYLPKTDVSDNRELITIDGKSGEVLTPLSEALATEIAKADYVGPGIFKAIEYLETSPQEASADGKPRWAAEFDDSENTTLYIDPDSAIVTSSRSTKWRIFDFFWKLHIMDYDDGENFNHPLLIIAALIAMLVVLSGFTLLFIRLRRLFLSRRQRGGS